MGRFDSKFGQSLALHVTVKLGNDAALQYLLNSGAWIEDTRCRKGPVENETALIVAAKTGNMVAADILLSRGANLEARNYDDQTPLHAAIAHAKLDMVRLLLGRGADVSSTCNGESVLHSAVRSGRSSAVQFFIDLGNEAKAATSLVPWPEEAKGVTAFHLACTIRSLSTFWVLILHGMDYFGSEEMRYTKSFEKPVERSQTGNLPIWADASLGLKFSGHPIVDILERNLLLQTSVDIGESEKLSDHCTACQLLAKDRPEEFQIRAQRLSMWKIACTSFNYGYLRRCEMCRAELTEFYKGLQEFSAEIVPVDGRSYAHEGEYSILNSTH